jgi:hypothetical protein
MRKRTSKTLSRNSCLVQHSPAQVDGAQCSDLGYIGAFVAHCLAESLGVQRRLCMNILLEGRVIVNQASRRIERGDSRALTGILMAISHAGIDWSCS